MNGDLVNLLKQAIIFDGNKLDKNYNNNSLFGFINLDLIKKLIILQIYSINLLKQKLIF